MSLSLLFNTNKHFQSVKDDEYPLTYKYSPSKWERFRHDRQGNLTEWTDARGVVWHIEYGPF
ncbi:RHS repeat protein, partial [Xenorhabdus bovienii]